MKKTILLIMIVLNCTLAQVNNISDFNRATLTPDTLMPYFNPGVAANNGIRTVWLADDLDNDGKQEIIATDYSNNGRIHVMEMNGSILEVVWSSPKVYAHNLGSGSTPRWVRTGDMDGDNKKEIIFPLSQGSSDFEVQVWEWDGQNNNSFIYATSLTKDLFSLNGVGNFRTNRELGTVYDFDNDGLDELIMVNRDHSVYVLGMLGDVPGFGSWELEGGNPSVVPINSKNFSTAPWHSVPADLNGDGQKEIVNHMWNFLGFWTLKATATNTYSYPDTSLSNYYIEFLKTRGVDGVSFMGIQPVDVDGDGNQEITGIIYSGGSDVEYDIYLIDFASGDNVQYGWDSTKFGIIGHNLWSIAGNSTGSFWGIGAADLNANGKQEILLGSVTGLDVVSLEYSGTGSVLDPASYTSSILYSGGHTTKNCRLDIRDSLGVIDTVLSSNNESPFVSKMFSGSDINGNGKLEVIISYQSVFDSVKYTYRHWDGSTFVQDSIKMVWNPDQVTIRLLESTTTGIEAKELTIITPDDYVLDQNYPNPFNPTTTIRFSLPVDKNITLKVYDILGNEVASLLNDEIKKGAYEITWDGTNNSGVKVASGTYIAELRYGNFAKSIKMTLLK